MPAEKGKTDSPIRRLVTLDRMVHEPARLAVLLMLSVVDRADFLYILNETGMSKGNLSSHMAKLEEAGYISVEKIFQEKIPRTMYRLSKDGHDAFGAHRGILLEALGKKA